MSSPPAQQQEPGSTPNSPAAVTHALAAIPEQPAGSPNATQFAEMKEHAFWIVQHSKVDVSSVGGHDAKTWLRKVEPRGVEGSTRSRRAFESVLGEVDGTEDGMAEGLVPFCA